MIIHTPKTCLWFFSPENKDNFQEIPFIEALKLMGVHVEASVGCPLPGWELTPEEALPLIEEKLKFIATYLDGFSPTQIPLDELVRLPVIKLEPSKAIKPDYKGYTRFINNVILKM